VTQDGSFSRDSLADQAASWVPPWQRPVDRLDVPNADAEPDSAEPQPDEAEPVEFTEPVELPDIPVEPEEPEEEPGDYTRPSDEASGEIRDDVESASDAYAAAAGRLAALVEVPRYDTDPVAEPRHTLPSPQLSTPQAPVPPVSAYEAAEEEPETEEGGPPLLDPSELRSALEAILMVVDEPVGEIMLAQVLEQPAEVVADALLALSAAYTAENRGFELRRAAGGWRFYTRDAYASYVERFVLDGQSVRLTQAALETLAVVAYKQPVTRARISAIRGVNCDGVVRTLVSRGLIEEAGSEPDSGAYLYRTTALFLEKLGLDALDQLPPLAPFLPDNLEEIADADR
jgi:segregation and condensation protein B